MQKDLTLNSFDSSQRMMFHHKQFVYNLARSYINTENKFRVKSYGNTGLNFNKSAATLYEPAKKIVKSKNAEE